MCIAIAKPAKVDIPDERLEICFFNNPDGAGFAYYDDYGKLQIRKGYFKFSKFKKAYRKVCDNRKMLIHFRIKTVGEKNISNCHPFHVGANSAMVHNGTISSIIPMTGMSDSGTLASWITELNKSHPGFIHDAKSHMLIEALAKPSRICFMLPMRFVILNKNAWKDDGGAWYSNESFKRNKPVAVSGGNGIIPWHERGYEAGSLTYNTTPPLDFTRDSKPKDHNQGIAQSGLKPDDVYRFWSLIPFELRELLLKARDVDKRPHGFSMISHACDLYGGAQIVGTLSGTEIEGLRNVLCGWLFETKAWASGTTMRLSTADLLAAVSLLGMTAFECLEQMTAPRH